MFVPLSAAVNTDEVAAFEAKKASGQKIELGEVCWVVFYCRLSILFTISLIIFLPIVSVSCFNNISSFRRL